MRKRFCLVNLLPRDSIDMINNRTFLHNIYVRPGLPEYRQTSSARPVVRVMHRLGRALLFGVVVVLLFLAFLKYRKVF